MPTTEDRLNEFALLANFKCPPEFWPALGYEGSARYAAVYWEQCGDEASWADGRAAFCGASWSAYLTLMRANFPPGHPANWLLGGSDVAATFWLVIDRETQRAWLVPSDEAPNVLWLQWPEPVADVAADGLGVIGAASFEELLGIIERLPPARPLSAEEVEWRVAEEGARYEALVAALEGR